MALPSPHLVELLVVGREFDIINNGSHLNLLRVIVPVPTGLVLNLEPKHRNLPRLVRNYRITDIKK